MKILFALAWWLLLWTPPCHPSFNGCQDWISIYSSILSREEMQSPSLFECGWYRCLFSHCGSDSVMPHPTTFRMCSAMPSWQPFCGWDPPHNAISKFQMYPVFQRGWQLSSVQFLRSIYFQTHSIGRLILLHYVFAAVMSFTMLNEAQLTPLNHNCSFIPLITKESHETTCENSKISLLQNPSRIVEICQLFLMA